MRSYKYAEKKKVRPLVTYYWHTVAACKKCFIANLLQTRYLWTCVHGAVFKQKASGTKCP